MARPDDPKTKKQVDQLRDHEFDGIREYDNALPKWWLWLFLITIAFTPVYLVFYHFGGGGTSLQAELAADQATATAAAGTVNADASATDFAALAADPTVLANGKAVFELNCAPCHGPLGGGGIGPNLTDNSWIHGSAPDKVHQIIVEGVPDKGMPPWLPVLGVEKVNAATAFVMSLKNTNVANGKPPQGQEEP